MRVSSPPLTSFFTLALPVEAMLSFQRKSHHLGWTTSSIICREWQPKKEISRSLRKYTWVGRRSFVALGLLLIVFALFTNFTSVKSHYR